jgi:AGCS family alanine or glycine:cation symporter
MLQYLFSSLEIFDDYLWGYLGFPSIIIIGILLSFQSRFVQIRKFPHILMTFIGFLLYRNKDARGIHPLKAFFACVGGCVGLGNVVGICTAVQIGGPGSLFWIWITAILGMVVKYAEVYLGIKYRQKNNDGSYNGGPMYYLQRVFKGSAIPCFVCFLLCLYGVEVYQFRIISSSLIENLGVSEYIVVIALSIFIFLSCLGGIKRVGTISSLMIPVFVVLYVGMGFFVLAKNYQLIPGVIKLVFTSAFTGLGVTGGFVGSTLLLTISQGIRRGCYTGDIGIGYASVIHSESSVQNPKTQASLVIFDIFLDTIIICTTSLLIILVTDIWKQPIDPGFMVQTALSQYFPFMNVFMPFFVFLVGTSTINAYFCVGLKCAEFLMPKFGRKVYYVYALTSLFIFSLMDTPSAQIYMSCVGGTLLIINLYGIYTLRKEIDYSIGEEASTELLEAAS